MIDPHLHLIAYPNAGRYNWLKPENPPFWPDKSLLARPFSLADIALSRPSKGGVLIPIPAQAPQIKYVDKFVHIEAGFDNEQPWREVAWLEGLFADKDDVLKTCRSVACCDLTLPTETFREHIKHITSFVSVVGVRHILDDEALDLLHQSQVISNLGYLAEIGLIFEAQFNASDSAVVDLVCEFLTQYPSSQWVIEHAGGHLLEHALSSTENQTTPVAPESEYENSSDFVLGQTEFNNHQQLAQFPNLTIKASGWEMHNRDFSWDDVETTVAALVHVWGKDKVMIASNFPLLTWRMSYAEFWEGMAERFAKTPELLYTNAERVYFQ